jgi:hypothetical protein
MGISDTQDVLHEAERITHQAEQLRPCWDELLARAHAAGEHIREQVKKAAGDSDRPAGYSTEEAQFRDPRTQQHRHVARTRLAVDNLARVQSNRSLPSLSSAQHRARPARHPTTT